MESFVNNLALISIEIVLLMHVDVWLEAILFKHDWQRALVFIGLSVADVLLLRLLGYHHTLIDIEVIIVVATMIIFWNDKINIKESKNRMVDNDNK